MSLDDLIKKIEQAVEFSGYPLEQRVGNYLLEKEWTVFHSVVYSAPSGDAQRELDILAYKLINERRIELRISCKRSKSKPWVFFTEDRTKHFNIPGVLKVTPVSDNINRYFRIQEALSYLPFFSHDRQVINYSAFSGKEFNNDVRTVIRDGLYSVLTSVYLGTYPHSLLFDHRGTIYFFRRLSPSQSRRLDVTMLPDYWGKWFAPLKGCGVKQTNLSIFFKFGAALEEADKQLSAGAGIGQVLGAFLTPQAWLYYFLRETEGIPLIDSRALATEFLQFIEVMISDERYESGEPLSIDERAKFFHFKLDFEDAFAREALKIKVFAVTPKGIYDTNALIEGGENKFPKNLLAVMSEQAIQDLKEAGRCLAFEVPTACAFHICRATEALMLAYYEALTGQVWPYPKRDWYSYNTQLAARGAPSIITNRLGEIRQDRNAYAHPDVTVPLDEAWVVYELCTGVMFYMAKEIEKIEAAKVAASNPSTPTSPP